MTNQYEKDIKYVAVGDEIKDWGLYVSGAGSNKVSGNTEYPITNDPAHHYFHWSKGRSISEHQILYITRGSGFFEAEGPIKKRIKAGDVFMLFPGIWHRFKPTRQTGWDEYWVEFDGDLLKHIQISEILNPNQPVLELGVHSELSEHFIEIIEIIKEQKPGFQHMATGYLFQIFAQIFAIRKYNRFEGKPIENQIERAKLHISENLDKTISQTEIASEVGLSYSLYRKKFSEYTGFSPCQYHIQLRLNRAKDLLRRGDNTPIEIARDLGFSSTDYFYRIFKKKVGMTPSEYRKRNTT
ncbi:MAG: AraC family transcriptional regulator [Bacteroidota bacterium]